MKTLIIEDAERVLSLKQAIVLMVAVGEDKYQVAPGNPWRLVSMNWYPRQSVVAVSCSARSQTCVGDTLTLYGGKSRLPVCQVVIERIIMANADELTQRDVLDLGYTSLREFLDQRPYTAGRRVWLLHVTRLPSQDATSLH